MARTEPMTTGSTVPFFDDETAPGPLSKRIRGGWAAEIFAILTLGFLHDYFRNAVMGSAAEALRNAKSLTAVEQWVGIYHEQAVQHFFLQWPLVVGALNAYYDSAHFLVPAVVAIYLYRKHPPRYVRMRNTFLIMLFVTAPLCWSVLSITPPKYMPPRYGFVDTQVTYWNIGPQKPFSLGPDGEPSKQLLDAVGNIYGGLPSHHMSWALWCVVALWPIVRKRRRWLLLLYPVMTGLAVTVTGNHRFIDFPASCIEVAVAYSVAYALGRVLSRRRARRAAHLTRAMPPPVPELQPEPAAARLP